MKCNVVEKKKNKYGVVLPMVENRQFLPGNYRGALQEYIQNQGVFNLNFETKQNSESDSKPATWISTCVVHIKAEQEAAKTQVQAKGEATRNEQAARLAALAMMKKMYFISHSDFKNFETHIRLNNVILNVS